MSRYQALRRRLAPIAFGIAIALIARDACNKQQRTHATIVLDFGAATAQVHGFAADVYVADELVAFKHVDTLGAGPAGETKLETALPAEDAEVRIDLDLGAKHVAVKRRIHVIEGSTVTIPLADVVQPPITTPVLPGVVGAQPLVAPP